MLNLLRTVLVPVLLLGACWLLAVYWLGRGSKEIDSGDLLTWFLIIPALVLAAWFGLRKLLQASTPPAAEEAPAQPVALPAANQTKEPPNIPLAIVFAELKAAAGADALACLAPLREGKPLASPDAKLLSPAGLPYLTAACPSLDLEAASAWLELWAARSNTEISPAERARTVRSLALIQPALEQAAEALLPLFAEAEAAQTSQALPRDVPQRILLKIFASETSAAAVLAAFKEKLFARLSKPIPVGLVVLDGEHPERQHDALRVASQFARNTAKELSGTVLVLIGCDSLVHDHGADLYQRQHPALPRETLTPTLAEAAAIVVLLPPQLKVAEDLPRIAILHPSASGQRDAPVEQNGTTAETANALMQQALLNAQQTAAQVSTCLSDLPARTAWLVEHAQALGKALPKLDPVADQLSLASTCGALGLEGGVSTLALAAATVADSANAVLCALAADQRLRSYAVLTPPNPPSESPTEAPATT